MANTTAKVKHQPLGVTKRPNSWLVKFDKSGAVECVPYSVIRGHIPDINIIEIEVWWLKDRGIIY